jgi:hypothetical protein
LREDFARTARAVAGDVVEIEWPGAPTDLDVGAPSLARVRCDVQTLRRDRIAWSMTLGGYSAREIADVLGGHLTRRDLDRARHMLMAGAERPVVATFVESRWRQHRAPLRPDRPHAAVRLSPLSRPLETLLTTLALEHRIDPELVRAVIAAESAGDARARSPAGAIGLMQLMPLTAASLGVDPWDPAANLRGGISYLAALLRAYNDPMLALVAYNAGPQHADRVRAGEAVPYQQTRRYLDAIRQRYPLP